MNFCTLNSYFSVNVQSELEKWVEEARPTKKDSEKWGSSAQLS